MRKFLIAALAATAFTAVRAEAATYTFSITGQLTGSGSFVTSDTESTDIPGGYLITAMNGTFAGSAITLSPVGTLFADNMYFADGLHVDEDGWTFHAGSHDYNMYLSQITDANGTRDQLLIGYPGIGASSKHVSLAVTQVSAPVPEPGEWAMLGAGLGVAGWAARRRKAA